MLAKGSGTSRSAQMLTGLGDWEMFTFHLQGVLKLESNLGRSDRDSIAAKRADQSPSLQLVLYS